MSEDEGHSEDEDESEGEDGDNEDHNALLVSPAPHAARSHVACCTGCGRSCGPEHQMPASLATRFFITHERPWKPSIGPGAVQEDLIGHERERKRDEKLRAAAHASWLAQQDEEDVRRLMDGVQNGFRKAQGPSFLQDDVRLA